MLVFWIAAIGCFIGGLVHQNEQIDQKHQQYLELKNQIVLLQNQTNEKHEKISGLENDIELSKRLRVTYPFLITVCI